jgi:hypothetical protein
VTPSVTSFKTHMALNDTGLLDVVPEPWWKVDDPSNPGTAIAGRHDGHAVSQPDHPAAGELTVDATHRAPRQGRIRLRVDALRLCR